MKNLSGGELQRVALVLCLGKPADVYLIDEPSAYLDSEQRIIAAKIIKRFILHAKKTAFVVEHDFIMATYLADRVIVYEGDPGVVATANSPQSLLTGMNTFLKVRRGEGEGVLCVHLCVLCQPGCICGVIGVAVGEARPHSHCVCATCLLALFASQQLEITFRRDPTNYRPRINKRLSVKDMEQKRAGTYFFYDENA